MKRKSKKGTNEDLRAQIEQRLSQLTTEQKMKLLEEMAALSALYQKIMEETPEQRDQHIRQRKENPMG